MATKSFLMSDELFEYAARTWSPEQGVLAKLRQETAAMPNSGLQIAPDQGRILGFMAKLIGARRALEVGVFTGYSSTVVALALPPDGKLIACDVSEPFTNVAKRYWKEAGVENKVELRLGPAVETLDELLAKGESFDFCFIDADKPNYWNYFDRAVRLVRIGGLIIIDNVLWEGRVADPSVQDEGTQMMREFNEAVSKDLRVESCLVPLGDGFTLARRVR